MVNAWFYSFLYGCHDGHGQVACICGSTYLICNHSYLLLGLAQFDHCFHKVVAKCAVEPCCAYYHTILAELAHAEFACQFGTAIHAIGRWCICFHVWCVMLAVKNIVGRHLNHPSASFVHGSSKISRCHGIERSAQFLVVFSLIHGSISSAVHHSVYAVRFYV